MSGVIIIDIALRAVMENNKHFDLDYWVLRKSTNEQLASNLLGLVNFNFYSKIIMEGNKKW